MMRLTLPEPNRDPAIFQPLFERGMHKNPKRRENYEIAQKDPRGLCALAMPTMLDVEPTSRCNYRCNMCILSTWKNQKRAEDLTLAAFEEILDAQYGVYEIKLQGLGEPLLNQDFHDMVALCSERSIWTRTTTNASLLHVRDNALRLLETGIGEVQISLDGATKGVYESIRQGGNFEQFARNCELLNRLAAPLRAVAATRAIVLVQQSNAHQLEEILSFCAGLGFQRVTYSLDLGWFGVDDLREANQRRGAGDYITDESCFNLVARGKEQGLDVTFWQAGNKYCAGVPGKLCDWLWKRAYISSDCRIVPCCTISNPEIMDMGDARDLAEQWNADAYRVFRKAHLTGNIPAPCRFCYEHAT